MQERDHPLGTAESILDSITDAFFLVDSDWHFTYINRQAYVLLRRPVDELLGKSLWDEYPGLNGSEFDTLYRCVMAERTSGSITSYYEDHARWYEVHCYPASTGMAVYFRDATDRIEAEKKLRESETRFRLMADSIPQIVWITDADGRVEFFNQRWYDYTGNDAALIDAAQVSADFIHPDDQAPTMEAWGAATQNGCEFIVEHRILSGAGDYRWFLVKAQPYRDPKTGAIARWYGTSTDIHEQKKTAAELAVVSEESERRRRLYESFLSNTPDLAYVFDLDHRFSYANTVLLKMWGRTWDDAIGKNCLELGYERWHAEMHDREIEQVRATRREIRGEVPFEGTFGRRIYDYIFFPVFGPDGDVEAIAGTTRDVTDRKESEARRDALIRLTDTIRGVTDPGEIAAIAVRILGEAIGASRVGFGAINEDTGLLHVMREWNASDIAVLPAVIDLRHYGTFLDELAGGQVVSIDDVTEDQRTRDAGEAMARVQVASLVNVPVIERERLVALLYVNDVHARKWSDDDLALIKEFAERVRTASARAQNMIALQQSEARLREMNESLEAEVEARTRQLMVSEEALRHSQKMEAVGQLTGGIAHDFNNLLGGIMGSLELARLKVAQGRTVDLDRYIDVAIGATKRAASLTHRLLAFSRRQTLAPKATNLNRLVSGMEDLVRRTLGPAIELEVVGAGGLWLTLVDAAQLENAMLNLCINARDAMPDGGRVTIETANKWLDEPWASERGLPPGQYVSLCVTDTGVGMAPEVQARAFDPFFTTKPLGEGTGLGLSMVYGFARQSGGQIRIYSELDVGTTMCLYLPRHHASEEELADPAVSDSPDARGTGEVVLVVDDEATIRMLIVEVLSEAGYIAIEAADGRAALHILQSGQKIDLLITDVGLPGGLNGRQVADAARVERADLKVLFITGYAENSVFGNAFLEPGMQVLTKPFALDALARKIREMMEG